MKKIIIPVVAGVVLFSGSIASAATLDQSYVLGSVEPGSPSSLSREVQRLEYFIDLYNGGAPVAPDGNVYNLTPIGGSNVAPPPLPAYDGSSSGKFSGGFTSKTIDLGAGGWDYLMVKWANDSYYYWVGGLVGKHTLVNDVVLNRRGKPQEASHWRLFNGQQSRVPDGGATVVLFGIALLGAGAVRRAARLGVAGLGVCTSGGF